MTHSPTIGSPSTTPAIDDGQPKADPTKDRILDIAFTLFSERGYAGVSMQEIANAVGMTKAALYYHFADKQALFLGVFLRHLAAFATKMESLFAANLPLDATLQQIAIHVIQSGKGEGRRINTDIHTFISPEARASLFSHTEHPSAVLVRYLEAQQAEGTIRTDVDIGFAGPLFLSMISGQVRRFTAASINGLPLTTMSEDEIAKKIVAIFLQGVE